MSVIKRILLQVQFFLFISCLGRGFAFADGLRCEDLFGLKPIAYQISVGPKQYGVTHFHKHISLKDEFPNSQNDLFFVSSGSHARLIFQDRMIETGEVRYLFPAKGMIFKAPERVGGLIIRFSNLNENQLLAVKGLMGMNISDPTLPQLTCRGYTCVHVATNGLKKSLSIDTSKHGRVITMKKSLKLLLALKDNPEKLKNIQMDVYSANTSLVEVMSYAQRRDSELLNEFYFQMYARGLSISSTAIASWMVIQLLK